MVAGGGSRGRSAGPGRPQCAGCHPGQAKAREGEWWQVRCEIYYSF